MQGPGSKSAPRSASAITDTAPLRPCVPPHNNRNSDIQLRRHCHPLQQQ